MGEKEYLETKLSLETDRIKTENRMKELSELAFSTEAGKWPLLSPLRPFYWSTRYKALNIVYSDFAATIDHDTLKAFINLVIEKISL